jgi:hypothetical protein
MNLIYTSARISVYNHTHKAKKDSLLSLKIYPIHNILGYLIPVRFISFFFGQYWKNATSFSIFCDWFFASFCVSQLCFALLPPVWSSYLIKRISISGLMIFHIAALFPELVLARCFHHLQWKCLFSQKILIIDCEVLAVSVCADHF